MNDINPNTSSLLSQIQAQLQAGQTRPRATGTQATPPTSSFPTPEEDEADSVVGSVAADRRNRLLAPSSPEIEDLSSAEDLEDAQERVASFNSNLREAPVGRISEQTSSLEEAPLGQIIDIRV